MRKKKELVLSEDQARRLWERAAQLQAEAARREEDARREATHDEGEGKPKRRRLLSGTEDESSGYSLSHVKQAGEEVGIEPDFVELALAEEAILEIEGGGESTFWDRTASRYLGDKGRYFEVTRWMSLPAAQVWLALEEALTSDAQGLDLLEVRGGPVPEGGIAIFESPYSYQHSGSLQYWCTVAEVRRHMVQVQAEGEGCQVIIQAPVRRSHRVNGAVGMVLSTVFGAAGGLLGMGTAAAAAGLVGLPALPVALGLITVGSVGGERLSRWGYIKTYRWGFNALEKAFLRVLTRIERDVVRELERQQLRPGS